MCKQSHTLCSRDDQRPNDGTTRRQHQISNKYATTHHNDTTRRNDAFDNDDNDVVDVAHRAQAQAVLSEHHHQ